MEKNRIRPVKSGRTFRMSYSKSNEVLEIPNLIAIQKDSYQWFLGDGLKGEDFPLLLTALRENTRRKDIQSKNG